MFLLFYSEIMDGHPLFKSMSKNQFSFSLKALSSLSENIKIKWLPLGHFYTGYAIGTWKRTKGIYA